MVSMLGVMTLAQIDAVKPLAEGFGSQFLPYALAVACTAIVVLFKLLWDQNAKNALALEVMNKAQDLEVANLRTAHAAEIAALNSQLLAETRAGAAEVRKTLEQVMPLQAQLAEMIRLTERE